MSPKIVIAIGVALLLVGVVGFLFGSVGLVTADRVSGIEPPTGLEVQDDWLTLPPDHPEVSRRKNQAEGVVSASLVGGLLGVLFIVVGWRKVLKAH